IKSDGKRLDITLLRPLNWISESQADIGTTIFLDLPELGAQGFVKVRNIEHCPPIKSGKGNVITGTFHHEAANTIDLYVEGLSKPIGSTDNHPFWSVTRNEFVEAGKLQPDEELHLHNGQTAKVIQILPRPGPKQVHNLEVMNEHVYRVSDQGILVHNNYVYKNASIKRQKQNEHVFGTPEYNNRLKNPPKDKTKLTSVFLDGATAEHYVTETMKLATGRSEGGATIYEYDFKIEVGADGNGSPATRVRVIKDTQGQIHGYPY
ncbi:MAG: HINT domain-containing protein, partial [Planctomycetaceae bacterium]|nr:HINT domain-containing protein [Planctomycetaceae bacterium]